MEPHIAAPETSELPVFYLDGHSLLPAELVSLSHGNRVLNLTPEAWKRVEEARNVIDEVVSRGQVVYGVNTGFGNFASVTIADDQLECLQENLIRSHASGLGDPLSPERTRMMMVLRINVFAKGHSGISVKTLQRYLHAFNKSCLPWVPEKGTVGASGDLAPLAHLALGLLGEGKMWHPSVGWSTAQKILSEQGLQPIKLSAKEGLAMINGTALMTSLGAEAVTRAASVCKQADVVAALTLDVLMGTVRAFDTLIHAARPHKGQGEVAARLRSLLHSSISHSEIYESHINCGRVQDSYTLRCIPQVHGIAHDTVAFVEGIIQTEMNSATDNPMVFPSRRVLISGGNFHGEYPAKALDYLAIGVHEIASISERRIERLVNASLSELPAFLVKDGGLNSGFMIAHCVAASLVSENKVLTHPSSVDSISTSAAKEDHVSMGGFAARKALTVVDHVEKVIAIELLAACQGLEFRRPFQTTPPLEAVYALVRSVVPAWDKDRFMAPDIEAVEQLVKNGRVWNTVLPFLPPEGHSHSVPYGQAGTHHSSFYEW